jgi:hypothetical protein
MRGCFGGTREVPGAGQGYRPYVPFCNYGGDSIEVGCPYKWKRAYPLRARVAAIQEHNGCKSLQKALI